MGLNEQELGKLRLVGIFLFLIPFGCFFGILMSWPHENGTSDTSETRLFLVVAFSAALGSAIQTAKSYADHRSRGSFSSAWISWYWMRFPVGIGLALVMYMVLRGGLVAGNFADNGSAANVINPFGFAALSALTGMFAREASTKLAIMFSDVISPQQTEDSHTHDDRTNSPPEGPKLSALEPDTIEATSESSVVTLMGSGFSSKADVLVNGMPNEIERLDSEKIFLKINKDLLVKDSTLIVQVRNPPPEGGLSNMMHLAVK